MATKWLNYKTLRERLSFPAILAHYHVDLKGTGDQLHGYCPLSSHPKHPGKPQSPSFSANSAKGIWQCFGCGAKGNLVEFAVRMEGLDPEDPQAFRKVALQLAELFPEAAPSDSEHSAKKTPAKERAAEAEVPAKPIIVNAPLEFALKKLDAAHPYLRVRGFTDETISLFGLGFCSKGLMARRIAIPLHDQNGNLIGYAGRLVDDALLDEAHPRYRFPSDRDKDGVQYQFKKSHFLYNANRIEAGVDDLIIVESFTAVWWLSQAGIENVVAVMGASLSEEQARIIDRFVAPEGRLWLLPDGDDAGVRLAQDALPKLALNRFTRFVKLDGKQPTDCTPEELRELLPY